MIQASPIKLRSGGWGARVGSTNVREGDTLLVTTRAGKSWPAVVTRIVWRGDDVAIRCNRDESIGTGPDRPGDACADGKGRVPAVEVMINTPYIRECIQEREKTVLIRDAIAAGVSQYGMQTFDQSVYMLYQEGLISYEQGLRYSSSPDNFKLRVMGIRSASDLAMEEMEKEMVQLDRERRIREKKEEKGEGPKEEE